MTNAMMSAVKSLGVNPIEMSHALGEIAFDRFHNNMIMIGHLAPSMTYPMEPFTNLTQNFKPITTVHLAEENILATITA
jgi:hypothetical protein